jgi:cell division protein FtsX
VLGERGRRDASVALIGLAVGLAIAVAVVLLNGGQSGGGSPRPEAGRADGTSTTIEREGDVIVFLEQDVTAAQSAAIEQVLGSHTGVAQYEYWDHARSLEEAQHLFRDNARMTAKLETNPELVPPSYRVTLVHDDTRSAAELIVALDGLAGVLQATSTS